MTIASVVCAYFVITMITIWVFCSIFEMDIHSEWIEVMSKSFEYQDGSDLRKISSLGIIPAAEKVTPFYVDIEVDWSQELSEEYIPSSTDWDKEDFDTIEFDSDEHESFGESTLKL